MFLVVQPVKPIQFLHLASMQLAGVYPTSSVAWRLGEGTQISGHMHNYLRIHIVWGEQDPDEY